jgi:endonuclease YncB( thermonuclease family)
MIRKAFFWMLLTLIVGLWAYSDMLFPPEIIRAENASVKDGDTIVIDERTIRRTIRLIGIDAPEYRQTCKDGLGKDWPCGKAARLQLATFAASGSVICTRQATDKYGRTLAKCSSATVPDLGEAMVQSGLAISPAERGSALYTDAEAAAKAAKRGIWQGDFDLPADWRTAHPRGGAVRSGISELRRGLSLADCPLLKQVTVSIRGQSLVTLN